MTVTKVRPLTRGVPRTRVIPPKDDRHRDPPPLPESRVEAHARRKREVAEARAATAAAMAELEAAIADGERDYRRLAGRLAEFDRRLQTVRRLAPATVGRSRARGRDGER